MRRAISLAVAGAAALSLTGCGARTGFGGDATGGHDGTDPLRPRRGDASPSPFGDGAVARPPPPCMRPVPVDILLVIDDSSSMRDAQRHLAEQLPLLVRSLVMPPDHDADGRGDWPAPADLHIGVVSTSGQGGHCGTVADGVLIATTDCAGQSGRYLEWRTGDPADSVSRTFACMAEVGASGCELEQTFYTSMRALLPRNAPFSSCSDVALDDSLNCKGDWINAGFLRDDSLLVLMLLTNEDDASERFAGSSRVLLPVAEFVSAMRSLRPDPERFVYAPIAGIPPRLAEEPGEVSPTTIAGASELQAESPDPSCEGPAGLGYSPRRLIEAAIAFGDRGIIGSVCASTYEPVIGAVARLIGTRACDD